MEIESQFRYLSIGIHSKNRVILLYMTQSFQYSSRPCGLPEAEPELMKLYVALRSESTARQSIWRTAITKGRVTTVSDSKGEAVALLLNSPVPHRTFPAHPIARNPSYIVFLGVHKNFQGTHAAVELRLVRSFLEDQKRQGTDFICFSVNNKNTNAHNLYNHLVEKSLATMHVAENERTFYFASVDDLFGHFVRSNRPTSQRSPAFMSEEFC